MEPKVVAAAQRAGGGAWHYSKAAALTRQPGSGNNWAQGALRHAPAVSQQVLGMLRRQAERCDSLSGFLVMQVGAEAPAAAAAAHACKCSCWLAPHSSSSSRHAPQHARAAPLPPLQPQSMAGGTGSGLGSAMTAALRDEYPDARILNHCIWCASLDE